MLFLERIKPSVSKWFVAPRPDLKSSHLNPIMAFDTGFKYLYKEITPFSNTDMWG